MRSISISILFVFVLISCSSDDDCTCTGLFERPSGDIMTAENVNCSNGLRDDDLEGAGIVGQAVGTFIGCE
jgi:hypothetical protein